MSRRGWHVLRAPGALTVTRAAPPRFDLAAEATLPSAAKLRLAHQVRQDVWRALRRLRGFSPAVEVRDAPGGVTVRAGGRVDGPVPPGAAERIASVLADERNRRRWLACARPHPVLSPLAGSGAASTGPSARREPAAPVASPAEAGGGATASAAP